MLSGHDIICISTQDWDDLWTRKQRFMTQFARQGNRVLYVEQQVHLLGYVKRFKARRKRIISWLSAPRRIEENLYVYTLPVVLPFYQMSPWINGINNCFIAAILRKQLLSLNFKAPILWIYAPYSYRLAGKLGEKFVIYECVDELSAAKGLVKGEVVKSFEEHLIRKADLVIVTAQNLYDSKKHIAKRICIVPNGAEVEHFRKALSKDTAVSEEIARIKRPIVGFLGSISFWIDISLIQYIALSRTEWSIVMVGPVRTDISKINSLPNVYILGRKDYQKLPGYIKAFDVCINPYILDDVAEGCSPLKLYEYLSTGKPIVSVDMPEARKFGDLVRIAKSKEDFISEIELAFREDINRARARIIESEKHSWDKRFQREESIVQESLGAKMVSF